jgi:inositol oxygenase
MSDGKFSPQETKPLASLDHWEDDLLERYPDPEAIATAKKTEEYRNSIASTIPTRPMSL